MGQSLRLMGGARALGPQGGQLPSLPSFWATRGSSTFFLSVVSHPLTQGLLLRIPPDCKDPCLSLPTRGGACAVLGSPSHRCGLKPGPDTVALLAQKPPL